MRKHSGIRALVCGVLAACALAGGVRAEDTAAPFRKVNEYRPGVFTDIRPDCWCAENVRVSYEYGIMSGISSKRFDASGQLTRGQALAIACRLHSLRDGVAPSAVPGGPWYAPYLDYARAHGLISAAYENLYSPITRSGFAVLLAASLPASYLPPMNRVDDGAIPDVPPDAGCYAAVYLLYRAGVLTGNDKQGRFSPYANITRGAAAAVVSRMAEPSLRVPVTLTAPGAADTTTYRAENATAAGSTGGVRVEGASRLASSMYEDAAPPAKPEPVAEKPTQPESTAEKPSETPKPAETPKPTESGTTEKSVEMPKPAEPAKPFQPVPADALEHLELFGLSGAELDAAYRAAVELVRPLWAMPPEKQLSGIYQALRGLFDSGNMSYAPSPHSQDPYGFFVTHSTSDAGCASAAGLCLSVLGLPWEWVGQGDPAAHQWCRVEVGGTYWICDAYGFCCAVEPAPYVHPWL